ncbi:MAG: outer membrane beta-barrel protein [Gemmatimonadales bacterium]
MRFWMFATAWLGIVSPVASVEAQRPISFGVGGGISLPQGDVDAAVNTGWNALVTAALGSPMQPLGLRLDLAYNRFGFSDEQAAALGGEGHQTVGSATLNITYRLPKATWPVSPYILWGIGAYRTDCSLGPGCASRVRYGWNYGLGARLFFLGFDSFIEIRGHRTKSRISDVHYFPLTFGIRF